jgi:hypothetical protein
MRQLYNRAKTLSRAYCLAKFGYFELVARVGAILRPLDVTHTFKDRRDPAEAGICRGTRSSR